ncbi:uncharacterized protein PGTG_07603 [Puccinia graminis f. sp. tritici CRL 75-36-700-3]|uniref:Uncharacterized protein n=1 Tax=Puccinia graminis f. sp. tritici (strain CRL 75-36-700-3 / race SCCL) TaxID=418459 RepID=E3KCQ4_PUCGT|nr:uncharacterized protein PGTG_07603 [Puccinia graminis f. sp. tritici CRL 75-36-700-3]EFP82206.2 hypothetical protein PGTG_07603 [Puccinia graminis f. sp. tritici CRL 75-36-700-3]
MIIRFYIKAVIRKSVHRTQQHWIHKLSLDPPSVSWCNQPYLFYHYPPPLKSKLLTHRLHNSNSNFGNRISKNETYIYWSRFDRFCFSFGGC